MCVPEYTDDLLFALQGAQVRDLRFFSHPPPGADAESAHTRRFPAYAVAYAEAIRWIMLSLDAVEESESTISGWSFLFVVDEIPCRIRWTKSGLKLDLLKPWSADSIDPERSAESIEKRLLSAAKQVHRRVIAPRVSEQIDHNRVTVINQFARYRGMVDFFIEEIQRPPAAPSDDGLPNASFEDRMRYVLRESFFYQHTMIKYRHIEQLRLLVAISRISSTASSFCPRFRLGQLQRASRLRNCFGQGGQSSLTTCSHRLTHHRSLS